MKNRCIGTSSYSQELEWSQRKVILYWSDRVTPGNRQESFSSAPQCVGRSPRVYKGYWKWLKLANMRRISGSLIALQCVTDLLMMLFCFFFCFYFWLQILIQKSYDCVNLYIICWRALLASWPNCLVLQWKSTHPFVLSCHSPALSPPLSLLFIKQT